MKSNYAGAFGLFDGLCTELSNQEGINMYGKAIELFLVNGRAIPVKKLLMW